MFLKVIFYVLTLIYSGFFMRSEFEVQFFNFKLPKCFDNDFLDMCVEIIHLGGIGRAAINPNFKAQMTLVMQ
jgi:hypothetical protein